MKFYKCPICGNIITVVSGNEKLIRCCGVSMEELIPNIEEASTEKHIPVYSINGEFINVKVGEKDHPMTEEHYIVFLAQVIDDEVSIVKLNSSMSPSANFRYVSGSKIYAYCNIHGLWMNEVK